MIHLRAGSSFACLTSFPKQSRWIYLITAIRSNRRVVLRHLGSLVLAAALLLFCGLSGFAQAPTLAPSWNQLSPANSPPSRFHHATAYDAQTQQVVLFGGQQNNTQFFNDTWLWNGNSWTQANPSASPSTRTAPAMVYDAANNTVVLFGGLDGSGSADGDTWVWNGSTWSEKATSGPSPRYSASMAYDAATGTVVLFGGWNGGGAYGDTWVWDGSSWNQVANSGPSARYAQAMTYDAALSEVVLFGGNSNGNGGAENQYLGDTWVWNGTSWSAVFGNSPSARNEAAMDYDSATGQVVLFGGYDGFNFLNDMWVWSGGGWTQLGLSNPPSGRDVSNALSYDAALNQVVIFGGFAGGFPGGNDTWEFGPPQNFGNINVCPSGQSTPAPCSNTLTLTYNVATTTDFGAPSVVTQGATGLDFSLASGSTCTGTVSAVSTCTVNVTFAPVAPGLRQGAVELFTSGSTTPLLSTQIYGIGSAPLAAFSPLTTLVLSTGSQTLNSPTGVAVDAAGDLFIASGGNDTVVKVAANGAASTVGYQPNFPSSVAVDGAGDVFIGQFGPTVIEVPAGCTQANIQTCQKTLGGFGEANAVAVDAAGDVFVGDQYNREVVEIPASNQASQTVVYNPNDLSFLPQGLAVDLAGDLFIADYPEHKVLELPPGGSVAATVGFGWSSPQGVTLDAAGDLYVADSGLQEVVEIPAGCTTASCQIVVATATEPSLGGPGSNFSPYGVAVDSAGDVYIADAGLNRVDSILQQFAGVTFSESTVGNVSGDSPESITLQNIGNQALNAAPSWPVFTNPSFYEVSGPGNPADCDTTFVLAPGADCNVSMDFDPLTSGLQTGNSPFTLTGFAAFTDNSLNYSPSTAQNFSLTGTSLANGTAGAEFLLTVTEGGAGSGSVTDTMGAITCSESNGVISSTAACSGNYVAGTSVTLTASAGSGSTFVSWGGACTSSGTNPTCTVTMSQAQNVSASFAPQADFATANVCPAGVGTAPCCSTMTVTINFTSLPNVGEAKALTEGIQTQEFQPNGSSCTGTIGQVGSCTVNVTFTPQAPGLRLGAVQYFPL